MPKCALCVDGTCSSDCPALDLFPSDKEDGRVLAEKVIALGFKTEFIKDCLRVAKVSGGGLDLQKDFISMLILGHERGKDLAKKGNILAEIKKAYDDGERLNEMVKAEQVAFEKLVKEFVHTIFPSHGFVDAAFPSHGLKDFQGLSKCKDDDGETSLGDKEDSKVLAEKVTALGFKTEFIKDCLRAAMASGGGLDLQKDFLSMLILGHEDGEYLAKDSIIITEITKAKAENKKLIEAMRAQKKIHKKRVKIFVDAAFPSLGD